jgi:hypothetical protein
MQRGRNWVQCSRAETFAQSEQIVGSVMPHPFRLPPRRWRPRRARSAAGCGVSLKQRRPNAPNAGERPPEKLRMLGGWTSATSASRPGVGPASSRKVVEDQSEGVLPISLASYDLHVLASEYTVSIHRVTPRCQEEKMNDYGKRMEALIEDLGINDAELGRIIGADSPSTVGQAIRRNSKPQAATCLILAGLSRSHADRTFWIGASDLSPSQLKLIAQAIGGAVAPNDPLLLVIADILGDPRTPAEAGLAEVLRYHSEMRPPKKTNRDAKKS